MSSKAGDAWRPSCRWLVWLVWGCMLLGGSLAAWSQEKVLGDPFQGRSLLDAKLCTQCHGMWGHGGDVAPDISTSISGKTWLDLVGDFWNHTPRMMDELAQRGHAWPTLVVTEMANLLSYLYYVRMFEEPGDAGRGAAAYARLRCGQCHSLGSGEAASGGPLDQFSGFPSAVVLAQAMWNAAPDMQPRQVDRGARIPVLVGKEIADLQAYIRYQGLRASPQVELLPAPDPDRGAQVFTRKGCGSCHSSAGGSGPDLRATVLERSVAEIGGSLWNHSYAMRDQMRTRGVPFPQFQDGEMADLISYLYFLGFMSGEGSAERGRVLFDDRGCGRCHGAAGGAAVDLAESNVITDPVALSSAMWNHAPEMHEIMAEQSVAWPQFEHGDMGDLIAYLRTLAPARTAPSD